MRGRPHHERHSVKECVLNGFLDLPVQRRPHGTKWQKPQPQTHTIAGALNPKPYSKPKTLNNSHGPSPATQLSERDEKRVGTDCSKGCL